MAGLLEDGPQNQVVDGQVVAAAAMVGLMAAVVVAGLAYLI